MTETKRFFPLWLTVSVLVNILLVGLIAGFMIGKPRGGSMGGSPPPGAQLRSEVALGRGIIAVTPESDRREIGQRLRRVMAQGGGQIRDRQAARNAIILALRSETFDPTTVADGLSTLRAADRRLQDRLHGGLVEALSDLSLEQRQQLADIMESEGVRGAQPRQRFRDPRPPPPQR
ncbi:MAG: periplasmic heavy metal sensor [Pseudomonadota bacterium]